MRMDDDAVAELLVRFLRSCRDACCSIEGLKEFYARNHPDAKSIILRRGIKGTGQSATLAATLPKAKLQAH